MAVLPVIAAVAAVAGTAVSVIGSLQAGSAQKKASERQAAYEAEQARIREDQERRKAKALLGRQRAAVGASGVTMEGSPLLTLMDTATEYEKDLLNIRRGAQYQIGETLAAGEQAQTASYYRAGSTVLTGLGQTASTLYDFYRPNMPGTKVKSPRGRYSSLGSGY